MNLPRFAIRFRPVVVTLVLLGMFWGLVSVMTMPRREDPEYTVRTCAVSTSWPGAPTEKVEELITDKLEKELDSINEVKRIRSTTTVGLSTIYVDAEDSVTPERIDNVWDKVRARVERVPMPEEGIKPQVIDDYGDTYVILLAVYQVPLEGQTEIPEDRKYTLRELDVISERIKDELRLIEGVAKSEQFGVREEAIYVYTDMGTWSQLALDSSDLKQLVAARNIVAPGGNIDTAGGRFSVKPGGEFNAVEEIDSIVVGTGSSGSAQPSGGTVSVPVRLDDLGLKVARRYEDPPQRYCRYGDSDTSADCVIVALTMKSGANIVEICEAAEARVRELQDVEKVIPPDVRVVDVSDQSENVNAKISDVVSNVIGAIVIVIVVVWLVVGFRSASVMAANIPVVVLISIALITIFGVQLEQISLASIIIALGLLVDNAVQVSDQSRTNQMQGLDPVEGSIQGTNQVSSPMLIGTLTTIAAFFPMLLALEGSKREYVYSLPVTLTITLAISWIMALTFCTILAASFIRPPKDPSRPDAPLPWLFSKFQRKRAEGEEGGGDLIDKLFRGVAGAAIRAKWVTVGVAFALLFLALQLDPGSQFFPKDARDQFAVQVFLPENVSIEQTNEKAKQVEAILRKLSPVVDEQGNSVAGEDGQPLQRIRAMRTMVGGGGARWYLGWNPEPTRPDYAEILVRTTDATYTPEMAERLKRIAVEGDEALGVEPVAGARVIPRELDLGPSVDAPIGLRIYGPGFADIPTMRRLCDRLKEILRAHPSTWDVHDTWGAEGFQVRVDVDEAKANLAGVTNASVAQTLNAYFSGHHLTSFREGDHVVPVYLRLSPDERQSLTRIQAAFVEGYRGKVPLESIGQVSLRWAPFKIERRELNRMIEARARVQGDRLPNDVVKDVMQTEAMQQFLDEIPSGYRFEIGGQLYESREGQEQISVALGISVLLIVLCLVIQYNGWAKPVVILATLPLALIGAIPGLYLTGNPLGFMPQLGILSLFGIVLNTGVIFLEFADVLIAEKARASDGSGPICGLTNHEFRQCLVEAGKQRLLPIFLTTSTTIGGLIPLALAGGPLWEGLAWCMIFGLTVATVLTLLVVPALYAIFVETFGVQPFQPADAEAA